MALFAKETSPTTPAPSPRASSQGQLGGTLIGPNIVIEGTISGSETTVVEGTVRGEITLTSDLRVGTKGRVEAKVQARTVVVEGRVTGEIAATDRIELVAGSQVDGNIKAPKIIVAEGAKFRGNVDMGSKPPADEQPASKQ